MDNFHYIYLHGFASSPYSAKAQYLRARLNSLIIPDLNQSDFTHLTLTRQIKQVAHIFLDFNTPVILIGSSFGGLTAAWLSQKYPQVQGLILLAPAFDFLRHWSSLLGEETMKQWEQSGYYEVYHYGYRRSLPLHFQFIHDLQQYQLSQLQKPVPTLILHGIHDTVIPIESSREYSWSRPWVKLVELNSDHSLTNVLPEIWRNIQT